MNILFVHYHDFRGNSAVHIANLADALEELGVSCAVAVPRRARRTARLFPDRRFRPLSYRRARGRFAGLTPDLVHAWTPREGPRAYVSRLTADRRLPYVVHLEDNEDVIAADQLGIPREAILDAPEEALARGLLPSLSHPRRYREFLAGAAGATVIVEQLAEFVPAGVPVHVLRPAFEADLFHPHPPSSELRRQLGLGDARAAVYAGNVHPTNAAEVRELYRAIAMLNRSDRPLRLVRLGDDFLDFLGEDSSLREIEVRVPWQPRARVPEFYALADVLVQPGAPDAFNAYRLPSKLPEFFAMGIPVILPRANVGLLALDGEECLLLERGDAAEIAAQIERVLSDPPLREQLATGARAFAERSFDWRRSAAQLKDFYCEVLARR
jgi:glycosyltransferase involved in cell wall biosynthesis